MKKVCIIGCFADTLDLLNGQTVKTKIVYKEMKNAFGCDEVMKVDTYGGIKTLVKTPIIVLNALIHSQNVIILPAENGLRIIAPLLITFNQEQQVFSLYSDLFNTACSSGCFSKSREA